MRELIKREHAKIDAEAENKESKEKSVSELPKVENPEEKEDTDESKDSDEGETKLLNTSDPKEKGNI